MRIVVDRSRCVGLGVCESIAPDLFEVNDDGELDLLADVAPSGREQDVHEAVASCPTAALSVQE